MTDKTNDDKKRILDLTTKEWSKEDIKKLEDKVYEKYKYQVTFQDKTGKTKYAYTSDPVTTEMYLRSIGGIILKTEELSYNSKAIQEYVDNILKGTKQ